MGDRGHMTGDKPYNVTSGDRRRDVQGPQGQHVPQDLATLCLAQRSDGLGSNGPLALSYKSAGERIDRSARTIRRMVNRGELVGLRGQALVSYASLVAWVEARMNEATSVTDHEDGS